MLYWNDAALAMHLSGEESPRGAHLENYVLTDLYAWRDTETPRPAICYWRTAGGAEVDFVAEWKRQLLAVEVQSGGEPASRDVAYIRRFMDEYGRRVRGAIVVHTGDASYWLGDEIKAVPWWKVL